MLHTLVTFRECKLTLLNEDPLVCSFTNPVPRDRHVPPAHTALTVGNPLGPDLGFSPGFRWCCSCVASVFWLSLHPFSSLPFALQFGEKKGSGPVWDSDRAAFEQRAQHSRSMEMCMGWTTNISEGSNHLFIQQAFSDMYCG